MHFQLASDILQMSNVPIQSIMNSTHLTAKRLTRAEARVLAAIDEKSLVDSLVSMIQIPSVTGTDAESYLQACQAQSLRDLGFDVDHWKIDLDALAAHPEFPGTEVPRQEGYGTVGVLGLGSRVLRPTCPSSHATLNCASRSISGSIK